MRLVPTEYAKGPTQRNCHGIRWMCGLGYCFVGFSCGAGGGSVFLGVDSMGFSCVFLPLPQGLVAVPLYLRVPLPRGEAYPLIRVMG